MQIELAPKLVWPEKRSFPLVTYVVGCQYLCSYFMQLTSRLWSQKWHAVTRTFQRLLR
jgi:hypothetical protein|tara:strand:+ start:662 stop:835 length:174 start_codon:yes stop_codon:yes gene_type:complete